MDLFLNASWVRWEIIAFLFCWAWVLMYLGSEWFVRARKLWNLVFPQGRQSIVPPSSLTIWDSEKLEVKTSISPEITEESTPAPRISPEVRAELNDLAKIIRTKIARGEITEARAKIIEGLSIDKWHKDLNCLLASLYERDNEYRKAELIYKDLILVHDTDAEIYMKLWFSLSIQGKFEIAYEIYKKLLEQGDGHIEAAEMLANIAHELARHESAVLYSRMFLKTYPRNADMLTILSVSLIELGQKTEALEALEKLKNIDPYNPRVREMKDKLELELELAATFAAKEEASKNHEVEDLEASPVVPKK